MALSNWFKKPFSKTTTALHHYKSGIAKAEKKDNLGAIEEYTLTVDHATVDEGLKSMALFNRALAMHMEHRNEEAVADLEKVINMKQAHNKVKTAAKTKLKRILKRMGQV
ncbi:MAG: hypothetical protein MK106_14815 [Mariniblastus sp.]|nr:hypothetical protein [Mariniblastus sp.]